MRGTVSDVVRAPKQQVSVYVAVEWLLVALAALYLAGKTLPHAWRALNTDFPNYYLTARLSREKTDLTRLYEWQWVQRQKDHQGIEQRLVGLIPITPFSTLMVRPFASLDPLNAKRCWIVFNLGLLVWIATLIRSMTGMFWRQIAFVIALNFPLHRNLLYGQYYVLLFFVIVLSCWCYLEGRSVASGVLIGLGFGLKIFPILLMFYFLRKRDYRALFGGCIGVVVVAATSVMAFGVEINRIYLFQVLPWALRGEGADPYNLATSSFAVVLHRFFIYEPQWNPYPVWNAPWLFPLLHPLLQAAVFVPPLLFSSPSKVSSGRTRLEWASVMLSILTISTMAFSYAFTLLILPMCFMWDGLKEKHRYGAAAVMLTLYLVAGVPAWNPHGVGWYTLFDIPRLYALIGLCVISWRLLWRAPELGRRFSWNEVMWLAGIGGALVVAILGGLHHQRSLYSDYAARLPMPPDTLMVSTPTIGGDSASFVAMSRDGYQTGIYRGGTAILSGSAVDELSVAAAGDNRWREETGRLSNVVLENSGRIEVAGAEFPVVNSDGERMAFLREDGGRARLWLHEIGESGIEDRPLTPVGINVLEMSFWGRDRLVFAADIEGKGPRLYTSDMNGKMAPLLGMETRYPSVSPDGKWLAYSRLDGGYWNLWISELGDGGRTIRVTNAECNSIEPAWGGDSTTLVYASDCGRALWLTALSKRRVLP